MTAANLDTLIPKQNWIDNKKIPFLTTIQNEKEKFPKTYQWLQQWLPKEPEQTEKTYVELKENLSIDVCAGLAKLITDKFMQKIFNNNENPSNLWLSYYSSIWSYCWSYWQENAGFLCDIYAQQDKHANHLEHFIDAIINLHEKHKIESAQKEYQRKIQEQIDFYISKVPQPKSSNRELLINRDKIKVKNELIQSNNKNDSIENNTIPIKKKTEIKPKDFCTFKPTEEFISDNSDSSDTGINPENDEDDAPVIEEQKKIKSVDELEKKYLSLFVKKDQINPESKLTNYLSESKFKFNTLLNTHIGTFNAENSIKHKFNQYSIALGKRPKGRIKQLRSKQLDILNSISNDHNGLVYFRNCEEQAHAINRPDSNLQKILDLGLDALTGTRPTKDKPSFGEPTLAGNPHLNEFRTLRELYEYLRMTEKTFRARWVDSKRKGKEGQCQQAIDAIETMIQTDGYADSSLTTLLKIRDDIKQNSSKLKTIINGYITNISIDNNKLLQSETGTADNIKKLFIVFNKYSIDITKPKSINKEKVTQLFSETFDKDLYTFITKYLQKVTDNEIGAAEYKAAEKLIGLLAIYENQEKNVEELTKSFKKLNEQKKIDTSLKNDKWPELTQELKSIAEKIKDENTPNEEKTKYLDFYLGKRTSIISKLTEPNTFYTLATNGFLAIYLQQLVELEAINALNTGDKITSARQDFEKIILEKLDIFSDFIVNKSNTITDEKQKDPSFAFVFEKMLSSDAISPIYQRKNEHKTFDTHKKEQITAINNALTTFINKQKDLKLLMEYIQGKLFVRYDDIDIFVQAKNKGDIVLDIKPIKAALRYAVVQSIPEVKNCKDTIQVTVESLIKKFDLAKDRYAEIGEDDNVPCESKIIDAKEYASIETYKNKLQEKLNLLVAPYLAELLASNHKELAQLIKKRSLFSLYTTDYATQDDIKTAIKLHVTTLNEENFITFVHNPLWRDNFKEPLTADDLITEHQHYNKGYTKACETLLKQLKELDTDPNIELTISDNIARRFVYFLTTTQRKELINQLDVSLENKKISAYQRAALHAFKNRIILWQETVYKNGQPQSLHPVMQETEKTKNIVDKINNHRQQRREELIELVEAPKDKPEQQALCLLLAYPDYLKQIQAISTNFEVIKNYDHSTALLNTTLEGTLKNIREAIAAINNLNITNEEAQLFQQDLDSLYMAAKLHLQTKLQTSGYDYSKNYLVAFEKLVVNLPSYTVSIDDTQLFKAIGNLLNDDKKLDLLSLLTGQETTLKYDEKLFVLLNQETISALHFCLSKTQLEELRETIGILNKNRLPLLFALLDNLVTSISNNTPFNIQAIIQENIEQNPWSKDYAYLVMRHGSDEQIIAMHRHTIEHLKNNGTKDKSDYLLAIKSIEEIGMQPYRTLDDRGIYPHVNGTDEKWNLLITNLFDEEEEKKEEKNYDLVAYVLHGYGADVQYQKLQKIRSINLFTAFLKNDSVWTATNDPMSSYLPNEYNNLEVLKKALTSIKQGESILYSQFREAFNKQYQTCKELFWKTPMSELHITKMQQLALIYKHAYKEPTQTEKKSEQTKCTIKEDVQQATNTIRDNFRINSDYITGKKSELPQELVASNHLLKAFEEIPHERVARTETQLIYSYLSHGVNDKTNRKNQTQLANLLKQLNVSCDSVDKLEKIEEIEEKEDKIKKYQTACQKALLTYPQHSQFIARYLIALDDYLLMTEKVGEERKQRRNKVLLVSQTLFAAQSVQEIQDSLKTLLQSSYTQSPIDDQFRNELTSLQQECETYCNDEKIIMEDFNKLTIENKIVTDDKIVVNNQITTDDKIVVDPMLIQFTIHECQLMNKLLDKKNINPEMIQKQLEQLWSNRDPKWLIDEKITQTYWMTIQKKLIDIITDPNAVNYVDLNNVTFIIDNFAKHQDSEPVTRCYENLADHCVLLITNQLGSNKSLADVWKSFTASKLNTLLLNTLSKNKDSKRYLEKIANALLTKIKKLAVEKDWDSGNQDAIKFLQGLNDNKAYTGLLNFVWEHGATDLKQYFKKPIINILEDTQVKEYISSDKLVIIANIIKHDETSSITDFYDKLSPHYLRILSHKLSLKGNNILANTWAEFRDKGAKKFLDENLRHSQTILGRIANEFISQINKLVKNAAVPNEKDIDYLEKLGNDENNYKGMLDFVSKHDTKKTIEKNILLVLSNPKQKEFIQPSKLDILTSIMSKLCGKIECATEYYQNISDHFIDIITKKIKNNDPLATIWQKFSTSEKVLTKSPAKTLEGLLSFNKPYLQQIADKFISALQEELDKNSAIESIQQLTNNEKTYEGMLDFICKYGSNESKLGLIKFFTEKKNNLPNNSQSTTNFSNEKKTINLSTLISKIGFNKKEKETPTEVLEKLLKKLNEHVTLLTNTSEIPQKKDEPSFNNMDKLNN